LVKIIMIKLKEALEESIKLQSHYAGLLNMYDGGERLQFKNVDEWMDRLESLREIKGEKYGL